MRIIERLKKEFSLSGKKAKTLLDRRLVFVNDRRVWIASYEVSASDRVSVPILTKPDSPGKEDAVFLFEDEDLLALDKPAGIASTGPDSAESLVCKKRPGAQPVHRLDKDTSGVLLFGLSPSGSAKLLDLFKARRIGKTYLALVSGKFPEKTKRIDNPLDGKSCLTEIRILGCSSLASLLEIRIHSGRTHQIRRHLGLKGFHILGEKEYMKRPERKSEFRNISRHMLHAWSVEFLHPVSGLRVRIVSPPPQDFLDVCGSIDLPLPHEKNRTAPPP